MLAPMVRRLGLLLALLPAAATASAQTPAAAFVRAAWTTENGLPQNSITAIRQTRDGYLWLGTLGGLVRFDGVRFTVFTSATEPALPANRILALGEDRDGRLWIGAESGGLALYAHGHFERVASNLATPVGSVQAFHAAADGSMWVATSRGLAHIRDGSARRYSVQSALGDDVHAFAELRDGTLWAGTSDGISAVTADGTMTRVAARELADARVLALLADPDGGVWVATPDGVGRIVNGHFSPASAAGGAPLREVHGFARDSHGDIWAAGLDGLFRGRPRDGTAVFEPQTSDATLTVAVDREAPLWAGTVRAGLQRWRAGGVSIITKDQGLAERSALPILQGRDGAMWIGGMCGGVTRIDAAGVTRVGTAEGLRNSCVRALAEDRQGRLWIGTEGGYVHVLDRGRVTAYSSADGVRGYSVSAILEDRDGTIWIGTTHGLHRFTGTGFEYYGQEHGLPTRPINVIRQDRAGALWIGMLGGVATLANGRATVYASPDGPGRDNVREIYEDADGVLWIGTYGGGLLRFAGGRFQRLTEHEGLFDNVVSRILVDARDRFWMSGNRGVFRVDRAALNAWASGRAATVASFAYTIADGMRSSETNGGGEPAGWAARDGRLWFPTIDGVAVFDPGALDNPVAPPVAIEDVRVDGRSVDPASALTLAAGARTLEIRYTALSLAEPSKVRFRYQLENFDPAPIDAGGRRTAFYTSLPPGRYRFHLTAANNEGVWNRDGTALAIVQRPHFYRTPWFIALLAIACAGAAAGAHRARTRHLARRTRELEGRVAERTAEVSAQRNELARVNAGLARANDDMGAVLDRFRAAVVMVDGAGRITFLNHAAIALFDLDDAAIGEPWAEVMGVGDDDRARIEAAGALPPARRGKIPVRLQRGGRQLSMEIETEDDPRDPARRILFLYDVSDLYDLRRLLDDKAQFHGLVGESSALQLVLRQIRDVAPVDATVLIEGETGTGKELVARAIHYQSPRRHRPFVPVNCAGLTESLLTSQLFGHRRGAFTGAVADQIGLFEAADGGTIFLDEIGDVPAAVQTSLLRVLQEKEITRLGDAKPTRVNVRVIAATHRDLSKAVADGTFRSDLLYRIRVARVPVPPLRERRDDIPVLVSWFLGQMRGAAAKPVNDISRDAMDALVRYDWPGNVRELKSAIESAVIACTTSVIQVTDLPREVVAAAAAPLSPNERQRILEALARTAGNRAAAARLLGIGRTTLYRRLKELDISEPEQA
jgi:transcriptional regulator with PAS, ATPase and Fis domain/ligand-binding sensor domain-containing protein